MVLIHRQNEYVKLKYTSNPQLNFQQLSNNFLSFMRVLYLSFVLL